MSRNETRDPNDMTIADNRIRRLAELEQEAKDLRKRLTGCANDINRVFQQAGHRQRLAWGPLVQWTGWARVVSVGALSLRYGWRDCESGRIKYRTWLVEDGFVLFDLPEPWMTDLLELDETRRLLNHESRVTNGELTSLRRLHRSYDDLAGIARGRSDSS